MRAGAILAAILAAPGCGNGGVRWQGPTFGDAHAVAQRTGQLTFVYFRNWYSVACTNFEEQVLKHPDVLAALRGLVCVPLDYDWDRPLARRFGVSDVPAYVIVAADGRVLARAQAPITREELLAAIRAAQGAGAATAGPPP